MALKRLSDDVQSLIESSSQINCYKRAVEELVYNALDAKATCIAIRINLVERYLQVVDNGCGIARLDMENVGKKHMTSKCHDLATLRSVPHYYGYRGMALACIRDISEELKVISRHESTDESWMIEYYKGKLSDLSEIQKRSSKGTTIQIKGFLYNLNIQSKTLNSLQEIQEIKKNLEQISLNHNNLSFSLRDNVSNEIIFKSHKCKDIYQKIKIIFDIDNANIEEFTVEKDKYKIKALLSKGNDTHWIFLNGRYLEYCKLHQIMDEYLGKFSFEGRRKVHTKKKDKFKVPNKEPHENNNQFYIVFLTCPYDVYDLNQIPNKTLIEFQNWEQITKLIERLVKFYVGNKNSTDIKKMPYNDTKPSDNGDIRDKVKQIMQKVLGNKPRISQIGNCVKGKVVKRKKKKKFNISLSKIILNPIPNAIENKNTNNISIHNPYTQTEHENIENENTPLLNESVASPEVLKQTVIQSKDSISQEPIKSFPNKKKIRCTRTTTKFDVNMILNNPPNGNADNYIVDNMNSILEHINKTRLTNEQSMLTSLQKERNKKQCITINGNVNKVVIKHAVSFPQALKSICRLENVIDNCLEKDAGLVQKYHSRNDMINTVLNTQKEIIPNQFCLIKTKHNYEKSPNIQSNNNIEELISQYAEKENPREKKYFKSKVIKTLQTNNTYNLSQNIVENVLRIRRTEINRNDLHNPKKIKRFKSNVIESARTVNNKGDSYNLNISANPPQREIVNNKTHKIVSKQSHNREIFTYNSHPGFTNNQIINKSAIFERIEDNIPKSNFRFNSTLSKDNFSRPNCFKALTRNEKTRCVVKSNMRLKASYNFNNTKKYFHNTFKHVYNNDYSTEDEFSFHFNQQPNIDERIDILLVKNALANQHPTQYLNNNQLKILSHKVLPTYYNTKEQLQEIINKSFNITEFSKSNNRHKDDKIDKNYEVADPVIIHDISNTQTNVNNIHEQQNCNNSKSDDLFKDDSVPNYKISLNSNIKNNDKHVVSPAKLHNSQSANTNGIKSLLNEDNMNNKIPKVIETIELENIIPHDNAAKLNNAENLFSRHFNNDGGSFYIDKESGMIIKNKFCNDEKRFALKDRLNFVPKGLSPIFENATSKHKVAFENNNIDYFNDTLYKEFEKDVDLGSTVFEPNIQDVNELASKEIVRVNHKLQKYNAHIVFDASCLKSVKVLRQVDNKFIAARMMTTDIKTKKTSEYLVLFDQHAVHERIRLENNLNDYMAEDKWKPKILDNFTISLSVEEALYLHNYSEKFTQFGLQWTSVDHRNISVTAIPEAIFGKNVRNVDAIINAVKNLIQEQVRAIKDQKGCVSLYPKTIMDLVFSEACRYAIKFGDSLSKIACIDLLKSLQLCKTPFQCAHGRPVLAVLLELNAQTINYKVNLEKINAFKNHK